MNTNRWASMHVVMVAAMTVLQMQPAPAADRQAPPPARAEAPAAKPAPDFRLNRLDDPQVVFTPADLRGQVWLLNVWASWCGPCRKELPALQALADRRVAPIVGLNYRDTREQGLAWLNQQGHPFRFTVHDVDGKVGALYGVVGVPETYVIDKQGAVRLRHSGVVTAEMVRDELVPLIARLDRE